MTNKPSYQPKTSRARLNRIMTALGYHAVYFNGQTELWATIYDRSDNEVGTKSVSGWISSIECAIHII